MSDSQNYWTPEEMDAFMERRRLERLAREAAQSLREAATRADMACPKEGDPASRMHAMPEDARLAG